LRKRRKTENICFAIQDEFDNYAEHRNIFRNRTKADDLKRSGEKKRGNEEFGMKNDRFLEEMKKTTKSKITV
jgi:hypothetical protein